MSAPDPITQRAARAALDDLSLRHDGLDVRPWRGGWLVTVWDGEPCDACGGTGRDPERSPNACRGCQRTGLKRGGTRTVATVAIDATGKCRPIASVNDTRTMAGAA
jgi:hypothetical protein